MDPEDLIRQAADSVRSALDGAQRRARDIVAEAEAQAERVRAEAEDAAKRIRAEAEGQAQKRLEDVRSTLDELRGRLSDTEAAEDAGATDGAQTAEVDPSPVTVPEPEPPQTPEPMPEPAPEPMPEPVPEPSPPPGETDVPSAATANGASDAAARLVAMKLALDGASRDEARRQLAADYDVSDLDGLLEEVYAKTGK